MAYLTQHRYSIDPVKILVDGVTIYEVLSGNVRDFSIEKDFDGCSFPMITLSMTLPVKIYNAILNARTNVQFKIRIQSYEYDQTLPEKTQFKKDIINTMMTTYMENKTPLLDKDELDNVDAIYPDQTKIYDLSNLVTFYLFKEEDLNKTNMIQNLVFTESNMTNIITYLLSTSGYKNKVLMSKLDNGIVHKEVLVLPFTLLGQLKYLEQSFGFYETGSVLFFDFDRSYLVKKIAKCTAWESSELQRVVFQIRRHNNPNSSFPGSMIDEDNNIHIVNVTKHGITISNNTITTNVTSGNNLLVIDSISENKDVVTDTEQRGAGNYKVLTQNYENPFIESMSKMIINENATIVDIFLTETDISIFTPNKEYYLTFEDQSIQQDYTGAYRISFVTTDFINNGQMFIANTHLQLKKSII